MGEKRACKRKPRELIKKEITGWRPQITFWRWQLLLPSVLGERKRKGREEKKRWRIGQLVEIFGNRMNSDLGRVASRSFRN